MLSGELVGRSALSGEIQKQVIAGGGDAPIKSISVDGVEVKPDDKKNVNIDLSGKVDKTTEALKIYGTDSQGNQVQWIFRNTNNTKNTVAGRDSNGNIQVGSAINGTDAVNKEYAEGKFVGKTTGTYKVYGRKFKEEDEAWDATYGVKANTVMIRDGQGQSKVAEPEEDLDIANKKYVDDRFNGASKPISYDTYSEMITALNGMSATDLNRGQDIFIVQTGIPDVWVAYVEEANVPYTYVDDNTFVNELLTNGVVQVGYYKLGYLETQKVALTEYVKNTDYATGTEAGVVKCKNASYGLYMADSGETIAVSQATNSEIDGKTSIFKPITCKNLDYAVKKALADSKLADTDYAWTDDEKKSARALIGATNLNTHANYGVQNNASGLVMVVKATDDEITNKSTAYKPIVPTNLDFAIVQGLANNSITLSEEQKTAVQNWLGLDSLSADTKDINTSEFAKEFASGASAEDISSVYTWDKIASPAEFTQRQRACVYGNGYYVIAGTGGQVAYSQDGTNWSVLPSFTTGIITGLAYGNGYFLAVDSNGGIYRTDIPMNTWTNVHTFTGIIEGIRYINNTFVAVGENGFIGVSSDGKTWNEKQSGTTSNIIDVAYGDGKYVAVGKAGTILTSVNADIWYPQTIEGHTTDIRTVCYANGMFVMGTSGGRIDYSEDGETWLQANNPSANTISWIRAFSYSNNRLYAVMYTSSGAGEIWLSKDKGASWEVAQTTTGRLWCVTFGEDKFITSGDNGAIYVLDLNVEWSKTPIDAEYKWYRFKTTQNNGNIIYSDAYYDSSASLETVETMVGDLNTALETILGV